MKQAIVAVEDKRFYEHNGVDVRGIARALWQDIRSQKVVEGGSTITQQYVKNAYSRNEQTIGRKVREAALAWQLTQRWSKDRILTAYLNTIYFGNGAYGVLQASRTYFGGKSAAELTLPEAALLAGIPASPALYDPVQHPVAARQRRSFVLEQLADQGRITTAERRRAEAAPLPKPEDVRLPGTQGPAPYFVNYVTDQLVAQYGDPKRVFGGGLEVTTTLDLELQEQAREAIQKVLEESGRPGGRARRDQSADGRREGDVRRNELPAEPVQPRDPGRAPAGLVVQADRARERVPPGDRADDAPRLEADRDRRRRSHLEGVELRGDVPGRGRPRPGDGLVRQLGLRPADEDRRPEGDRRHGAQARDPLGAARLLLDRPRRGGRQPARHDPRVRDDRERRPARRRLDHGRPAAGRAQRQAPAHRRGAPERAGPRAGALEERGAERSPRSSSRSSSRAPAGEPISASGRLPGRPARRTTTATPGSSATRPSSSSPSGSGTRTSSGRWRRSSTASRSRAARFRR